MGIVDTQPRRPGLLWRKAWNTLRTERAHAQIIGGSFVMLIGSGLVSLVNFGYNVAVARMLGPTDFGHAAAAVTLLMLVSAITLAFQLVCAKFIAKNESNGARAAVYSRLLRRAWIVGIGIGALIIASSGPMSRYLHMPSPSLVILLALGISFYIPLGVKRGGFQGVCAFRKLTVNFLLESAVRFLGAIVFIEFGLGVQGAVGAIAASVMIAYFLPFTPRELTQGREPASPASFMEGIQAIVFFVGQVIINNVDILLVKHFFAAREAGLYAAVALVGRVVYFFSWSVMSAMFPISAQAKPQEENSSVVAVPLLLVLGISVVFALALGAFPNVILGAVFGGGFELAKQSANSLLMLYAAATGAYSLSVVLMAYKMSRKLANSGWIQLAFAAAIVVGISLFHSSLKQVIVVQLVLMDALFIVCAMPFFHASRKRIYTATSAADSLQPAVATTMKRIRRVREAEVISEFLKNEYYHHEFEEDRERFRKWVEHPDITNQAENALRRALLFRRRENMWRELPEDTEWWEVEVSHRDLARIRVFPRAQWRKIASGNFQLTDIVRRIRHRNGGNTRTGAFIQRLHALSERLRREDDPSGVLLIGIDETQPLTIIEGNHRVTAATLASPELALKRFRYYCGFSPRMNECCWYQTNLTNLWRYARNRMKVLAYDREAEIAQILQHHTPVSSEPFASSGAQPLPETADWARKNAS